MFDIIPRLRDALPAHVAKGGLRDFEQGVRAALYDRILGSVLLQALAPGAAPAEAEPVVEPLEPDREVPVPSADVEHILAQRQFPLSSATTALQRLASPLSLDMASGDFFRRLSGESTLAPPTSRPTVDAVPQTSDLELQWQRLATLYPSGGRA